MWLIGLASVIDCAILAVFFSTRFRACRSFGQVATAAMGFMICAVVEEIQFQSTDVHPDYYTESYFFSRHSNPPRLGFRTVTDASYHHCVSAKPNYVQKRGCQRPRIRITPIRSSEGGRGHPPQKVEKPRDDTRAEEGVEPVIGSDKNHDPCTTGISFHVILLDPIGGFQVDVYDGSIDCTRRAGNRNGPTSEPLHGEKKKNTPARMSIGQTSIIPRPSQDDFRPPQQNGAMEQRMVPVGPSRRRQQG